MATTTTRDCEACGSPHDTRVCDVTNPAGTPGRTFADTSGRPTWCAACRRAAVAEGYQVHTDIDTCTCTPEFSPACVMHGTQ